MFICSSLSAKSSTQSKVCIMVFGKENRFFLKRVQCSAHFNSYSWKKYAAMTITETQFSYGFKTIEKM